MSLVRRQSPEQIEFRTRHRFRRAAIGVAACIGSLLGISAAATGVAAHKVDQGQEAFKDYLMPDSQDETTYRHVSQQQPDANEWPPVAFHLSDNAQSQETPRSEKSDHDLAWAAGMAGAAGTISFGALVLLGAAKRRNEDPNAPEEVDYETTDEYGLYDFELRQMSDETRMQEGLDQLDTDLGSLEAHLATLEQKATAGLIAARLGQPVTLTHMNVLNTLDQSPLGALNYACPDTFYERLEQGESVAAACQPIWPELQQI